MSRPRRLLKICVVCSQIEFFLYYFKTYDPVKKPNCPWRQMQMNHCAKEMKRLKWWSLLYSQCCPMPRQENLWDLLTNQSRPLGEPLGPNERYCLIKYGGEFLKKTLDMYMCAHTHTCTHWVKRPTYFNHSDLEIKLNSVIYQVHNFCPVIYPC